MKFFTTKFFLKVETSNFSKGLVKWSLLYTTDVSTNWYRIFFFFFWYRIFKDNLAVSIQMSREHAV